MKTINSIMKKHTIIPVKFKHKVEDFIVEEIGENWRCKISENFSEKPQPKIDEKDEKEFLWCELEKQNIDHFTAIKEISRILNKSRNDIGYAGTKDKRAWTSQRISIQNPDIKKINNFNHPNIILKNFKWNKRKIKIGYLQDNNFKITLRDIDKKDAIKISQQIRKLKWFPNYFGLQRFGKNKNNVNIGKLILKRNFKKAVEEISKDNPRQKERLEYHLKNRPNDYLGALKKINKKNMLMFIHSVQSKIFNEILETSLKNGLDFTKKGQTSCLLIGYKTRFFDGELGNIEQQVLKNNNLKLEDFDIKEIPYLRTKGSFRKAITEIKNLDVKISDDDEFENSKKIKLEFILPSGAYATTFLENFFILK